MNLKKLTDEQFEDYVSELEVRSEILSIEEYDLIKEIKAAMKENKRRFGG